MNAAKDVDSYLAALPPQVRNTLEHLRDIIKQLVPPGTTEIMSYGMPTFKYNRALVGYAGFKEHCSLFPYNAGTIVLFKNELAGFSCAKGTIRFTIDKQLPDDLVRKIVSTRIAENTAKPKKRGK